MIINSHSFLKKPVLNNLFQSFSKFSFREHLKHKKSEPKAYRRILPSAKNLIAMHNIKEEELPDDRIIKKEHILQIIKDIEKRKSFEGHKIESTASTKLSSTSNPPKINLFDEVSLNKEIDYNLFKNMLPHSYYYLSANIENLLRHLEELNLNHKKNIKLEDFVAKIVAKLINKDNKLKILFDTKENKFINYQNAKEIQVYVKKFQKSGKDFKEEQFVYSNPHSVAIAEISKSKKNLTESNEKFTPLIRLFNYSEADVLRVDELIVPPSLLSLSIGKAFNRIIDQGEKFTHARYVNLTLTGVATVFQEDSLSILLENIVKYIEQPLTISL